MDKDRKRILLVAAHNVFRESLAARLSQEEDLEVAWQAGSVADTRDIHLDGSCGREYVDRTSPEGLVVQRRVELVREY